MNDINKNHNLRQAKTLSEEIAIEMYEEGFVTEIQLENFLTYARSKMTDRIVVFGDDIRDKAKLVYVEAAKRVEL